MMAKVVPLNRRPPQSSSQPIDRILDVLEVFLRDRGEPMVADIADATGLSRRSVQRIVAALEQRGYLDRDHDSRQYRIGVRLFELGARFHNQLDLRRAALPELTSLVEQTQQAAFLCIRDGDDALCLDRVGTRHRVRLFTLHVGERQPLHCGAAPRALLAGLTDAELLAYAKRTALPGFTGHTIATPEALLADANATRRRGYVVSDQDVTVGIAAVGAPVRDHSGQVVAAISVSGLAASYTPERVDELAEAVRSAARVLSARLGFRGDC
jgi:IclR family acetate operon transcriptional repressor